MLQVPVVSLQSALASQGFNDLVAMDRPLSGGCNVKCGIDNVPDTSDT